MELVETMRAEDGAVEMLDRHVERLAAAATHFGYPLDRVAVRRLVGVAASMRDDARCLRLTLDAAGRINIGTVPLDRLPPMRTVTPCRLVEGVDPDVLRFKTTARAHYDTALVFARAAGADEAVLFGADGRVVEATRANVWVRRGARLLTPPLGGRGLPGVMRAHLLDTRPDAAEAVLLVDDLRDADEVLLSNAVRGLFRVRLGTAMAQAE